MKDEEIIAWIGERTLSDGSTLMCCRAHLIISCPDERTVPMIKIKKSTLIMVPPLAFVLRPFSLTA